MRSTDNMSGELPDFEKKFFAIKSWLKRHASDPHAGLMLRDYMNDNCSCDFTDGKGRCELCGAKQ